MGVAGAPVRTEAGPLHGLAFGRCTSNYLRTSDGFLEPDLSLSLEHLSSS